MHSAPMWLLAVAATSLLLLGGIEGRVFEMPPAMQQAPPPPPPPQSSSSAYAQALREAYAEALNANANHGAVSAATDAEEEAAAAIWLAGDTPPFSSYFVGRQNALLLPQAEKRVKPSLSISNSLDVLRQQVMLEYVRRQMRENMKQVKMNRDHLDTIGKRSGADKRQEAADRQTRQQTHAEKDGLYRLALRNQAAGQFGELE